MTGLTMMINLKTKRKDGRYEGDDGDDADDDDDMQPRLPRSCCHHPICPRHCRSSLHQKNHLHHHHCCHHNHHHCYHHNPKNQICKLVVISKHHQTFLGSEILWAISPPLRYLRHPSIVWIRLFCSKRENTFFSCWCLWDDHHFSTHSLSYRPASRIMVIVIIIQCKDGVLVWVGVGANQYVVL